MWESASGEVATPKVEITERLKGKSEGGRATWPIFRFFPPADALADAPESLENGEECLADTLECLAHTLEPPERGLDHRN